MANKNAQNSTKQISLFEKSFSTLKDPRRTDRGHFYYPLDEILLLVISAVVCGYKDWELIAAFGQEKIHWLRRFYPYAEGTPGEGMLKCLFRRIDTTCFSACFTDWVNAVSKLSDGEVVAIDGKTICGSGDPGRPKSAIHIVSAYASDARLCLGQQAVGDKSNEITAIPRLLDLLSIKGCTITIDAMGCQREIASKIVESKAHYVLAVKDNNKELAEQVSKMFSIRTPDSTFNTLDTGHGRIEERICQVIGDLTFLDGRQQWKGLTSVARVISIRIDKRTKIQTQQVRYYISSLAPDAAKIGHAVRSHWGIENRLHWQLDVIMGEDAALKRKDNSAKNFNIVYKLVLAMLEKDEMVKGSKNKKRQKATLDDNYREALIRRAFSNGAYV